MNEKVKWSCPKCGTWAKAEIVTDYVELAEEYLKSHYGSDPDYWGKNAGFVWVIVDSYSRWLNERMKKEGE